MIFIIFLYINLLYFTFLRKRIKYLYLHLHIHFLEMATLNTEIRKLQPIELCKLAQILDQSNLWKELMAIIPNPNNESQRLFTDDHFK